MPVIPVGEWLPDVAALGNPGALVAKNCVPGVNSYKSFKSFVAETDALAARARGAVSLRDKDNNVYNFAGDASKLYQQVGTSWNDVAKSGGYSSGDEEVWEFAQWKNKVLATNFSDAPQQVELGGTVFSDLTSALRGRHIAVVRDFVVFGNTFDTTDGGVPDRIRWSAFNDETDYTVSPTTGSDVRDLKSGGWIQKIVGGEFGIIVSERSTFRMSYVGAPLWFQIDEVLPGVGTYAANSVVNLGGTVFYWSDHGVVAIVNGTGVSYPGAGKIDRFLQSDLDRGHAHRISAVADPRGGRVYWAYPSNDATSGQPDKVLVYDATLNKWSLIEDEFELLWRAGAPGLTLEELDNVSSSIDALTASLDSSQWNGGDGVLAAFDDSHKHGFFTGSNMTATIDTRETEIHSGRRTHLNAFRPLVDGGTVTAKVGTRNRQTDSASFGSSLSLSSSGRFTTRANARYHRFRLTITGDWTDAIGVQVEAHEARRAEMRG